ncbi:uncharacterized protein EI97DRAFT_207856 [Westerdykella ornata]|uniref:Uncharacterized protein n=1 Tax=Westerdykella ornata TaxID=318751 RepID=A0A6A6JBD5_WESOR|nr:uncharacterized protein EI97DRAFT_207856 [Westerdykella ornata]KAF2272509.1 hypothetical protein EI97DRAFT_207856 [Westerdykella ornata]
MRIEPREVIETGGIVGSVTCSTRLLVEASPLSNRKDFRQNLRGVSRIQLSAGMQTKNRPDAKYVSTMVGTRYGDTWQPCESTNNGDCFQERFQTCSAFTREYSLWTVDYVQASMRPLSLVRSKPSRWRREGGRVTWLNDQGLIEFAANC